MKHMHYHLTPPPPPWSAICTKTRKNTCAAFIDLLNRASSLLNHAHVYSHPRARARARDLANREQNKGSVSVFPSFGTNDTPYPHGLVNSLASKTR